MGKASKLAIIVLAAVCVFQFYIIVVELRPKIKQQARQIEMLSYQVSDLNNQVDSLNSSLINVEILYAQKQETATGTRNFKTQWELMSFLQNDSTHLQKYTGTFDCADYAEMLARHAAMKGFRVYTILVDIDAETGSHGYVIVSHGIGPPHTYYFVGNHMCNIAYVEEYRCWVLIEQQTGYWDTISGGTSYGHADPVFNIPP